MRASIVSTAALTATLVVWAPNLVAQAPAADLVPAERDAKVALGKQHGTAMELYAALKERANGGTPLSPSSMPDWTGLWQRVGAPFFDPTQKREQLTTAKLKPAPLAELKHRRELSAKGVEYDPISDCGPPGFPRWLAIPFLREFIVTPTQTYLFSETVNNMRRVYTDGREHPAGRRRLSAPLRRFDRVLVGPDTGDPHRAGAGRRLPPQRSAVLRAARSRRSVAQGRPDDGARRMCGYTTQ